MNLSKLGLIAAFSVIFTTSGQSYAQDVFQTGDTTRSYNFLDVRKGVKNAADQVLWLTLHYDVRDNLSFVAEYITSEDNAAINANGEAAEISVESDAFTVGISYRNELSIIPATDWVAWLLYGKLNSDRALDFENPNLNTFRASVTQDIVELYVGIRHSFHPRIEADLGGRVSWTEDVNSDNPDGTGQVLNTEAVEAQLIVQLTNNFALSVTGRDITDSKGLYTGGLRLSW